MAGGTGAAAMVKVTGMVTGVTPLPPLRVTEPVWGPVAKLPVAALNVTAPLPVPEAGLTVNQAVDRKSVEQGKTVALVLLGTVRMAGCGPTCAGASECAVGLAPMAGDAGAAATVTVTRTVTGLTPVPPLRVTEPVWGPVAKLPVAALNVTAPLPVPEAGLTVNQA